MRNQRARTMLGASIWLLIAISFPASACDFDSITFSTGFEGASLDACEKSQGGYTLRVNPENEPINPSPWYAFNVESKTGPQTIAISLIATNAKPRYTPKISDDGVNWREIPFRVDDNRLLFDLDIDSSQLFVSAQPLLTEKHYNEWMKNSALNARFVRTVIGKSVEGRDIHAFIAEQKDNDEWFIIIGRQHPPEISGAFATLDFIDALVEEKALNERFFSRFNVLMVPFINPDGTNAGHWRHNMNGIDLNRDWGKFTQPETRAVRNIIEKRVLTTGRIVFAFDFHSTQQDIFYTMPEDYGLAPASFSVDWYERLKDKRIRSFTMRERPGSRPGNGVFKQYIADAFGVHSITYEMGDNTTREMVRHIAQVSAETIMEHMLDTPPEAFKRAEAKPAMPQQ